MNSKPPTIPFRVVTWSFSDNPSRNSCIHTKLFQENNGDFKISRRGRPQQRGFLNTKYCTCVNQLHFGGKTRWSSSFYNGFEGECRNNISKLSDVRSLITLRSGEGLTCFTKSSHFNLTSEKSIHEKKKSQVLSSKSPSSLIQEPKPRANMKSYLVYCQRQQHKTGTSRSHTDNFRDFKIQRRDDDKSLKK